jgi:hypothetical protein
MRRLAFLATAVLAATAAPAARGESLDLDLTRLGPPDSAVWGNVIAAGGGTAPAQAVLDQYAKDSKQRFALLSTEMALAMSSALLRPASTTGYSGYAIDLEAAFAEVHPDPIGVATAGFKSSVWPTASAQPTQLLWPSVHVRKALPFSFEVGGRLLYLNTSNYFAAQGEAAWAINEGFEYVPDFGVRAAYTRMLGVKDWNLSATDLDFLVSMRFAVGGVTSFTPYLATRFTYVSASTARMDFAPCRGAPPPGSSAACAVAATPDQRSGTQASFPLFSSGFYRTTLGLRFTTYTVSLAVEGTYFSGASPSVSEYDGVKIPSSFSGAAKLGWEW